MAQYQFQEVFPEKGALPAGSAPPPAGSKVHRFRLRQLLDLATAYGITLPPLTRSRPNYTKEWILPYLQRAEEEGVFQQPPKSMYHLLHASMDHDARPDERQQDALERQMKAALREEQPLSPKERYEEQAQGEPESFAGLQQRAKAMGLRRTAGLGREALQKMVDQEELRQRTAQRMEANKERRHAATATDVGPGDEEDDPPVDAAPGGPEAA